MYPDLAHFFHNQSESPNNKSPFGDGREEAELHCQHVGKQHVVEDVEEEVIDINRPRRI